MKTITEIVNEEIEFRKAHPRCESNGYCIYMDGVGNMCAFGRAMIDPRPYVGTVEISIDDLCRIEDKFDANGKANYNALLMPEYRGHSRKFWGELQELHDCASNWINNGDGGLRLSIGGETAVKAIIEKYETAPLAEA